MILKPKNYEELTKLVQDLPEEKRKVIVVVGRHPNEGTINIATRHHKDWEEHGAVVVRIPPKWTPHGFWKQVENARKKAKKPAKWKTEKAKLEQQLQQTPDDSVVVAAFIAKRIRVPIVGFHGTGGRAPFLHIKRPTPWERQVEFYYKGRSASKSAQDRAKNAPKIGGVPPQLGKEYLNHEIITREDLQKFDEWYSERFSTMLKALSRQRPR